MARTSICYPLFSTFSYTSSLWLFLSFDCRLGWAKGNIFKASKNCALSTSTLIFDRIYEISHFVTNINQKVKSDSNKEMYLIQSWISYWLNSGVLSAFCITSLIRITGKQNFKHENASRIWLPYVLDTLNSQNGCCRFRMRTEDGE